MELEPHLSEDQIKNYHAHKLTPAELLQMDEHIENCLDCSSRLLQNSKMDARVATLDQQLNSEAEEDHLEYEQLVRYLEHKLDPSDLKVVETHLQSCPTCSAEEQDLRGFSKVIKDPKKGSRYYLQFVGVAAAIVVFVLAVRILLTPPNQDPVAFEIQDGKYRIAFNKEGRVLNGKWTLPDNDQQQLQHAFEGRDLELPEVISELRGKKGILLSEDVPESKIQVIEPMGTVLSTDKPTFRWKGPENTEGYTVSIYDLQFNMVAQSPSIVQKEWTIETPIERGKTYIWIISTRMDGQTVKAPIPPAPEARFHILSSSDHEKLTKQIEQSHGSHLLLGLHYLEFGLLEDAQREWLKLAQQNPNSAKAQSLVRSLESLRQR